CTSPTDRTWDSDGSSRAPRAATRSCGSTAPRDRAALTWRSSRIAASAWWCSPTCRSTLTCSARRCSTACSPPGRDRRITDRSAPPGRRRDRSGALRGEVDSQAGVFDVVAEELPVRRGAAVVLGQQHPAARDMRTLSGPAHLETGAHAVAQLPVLALQRF